MATWREDLNSQELLSTGHLTVTREAPSWVWSRSELVPLGNSLVSRFGGSPSISVVEVTKWEDNVSSLASSQNKSWARHLLQTWMF